MTQERTTCTTASAESGLLPGVEDDDRDGAGCFFKENRTLWVGGVPAFDEASAREKVRENFGAWGRVSSVRLVKNKSCAFVQYAYRANAEFAKEAMSNQALLTAETISSRREAATVVATDQRRLGKSVGPPRPPSSSSGGGGGCEGDNGPVLHVRWAAEDPNPRDVIRAREGHAQTLLAAHVATGALPPDVTGRLPGADRALLRKAGMDMSNPSQVDLEFQDTQRQYLAVQGSGDVNVPYPTMLQYPDTDHQYLNTLQYPDTDHQYPSTDYQYPRTNSTSYCCFASTFPATTSSSNHTGSFNGSTGARGSTHHPGRGDRLAVPVGVDTIKPADWRGDDGERAAKRQSRASNERRPPTAATATAGTGVGHGVGAAAGVGGAAGWGGGLAVTVAGGSLSLIGGYGSGESD